VSIDGLVTRLRDGTKAKQFSGGTIQKLQVSIDGVCRGVHQLVAETFLTKTGPIVRHLNDHPQDNWLENLAYGSRKDNARDAALNMLKGNVQIVISKESQSWFFFTLTEAASFLGCTPANLHTYIEVRGSYKECKVEKRAANTNGDT